MLSFIGILLAFGGLVAIASDSSIAGFILFVVALGCCVQDARAQFLRGDA